MPFHNVTLKFPDSGAKGFLVHGYESTDAVNELWEIRLEVSNIDAELDVTTVVGETIEIGLTDEAFVKQRKGLVRRVRQLTSEPTGTSLFELIVVPPLWLTTRRRDSRIFQNKGCDKICEEVLALYGARIPAATFGGSALPKPEYRVQYDETDHDFLFRIFAEEGVTTLFDEETGDGAFNLMNGLGLFVVSRGSDIPFVPPAGPGSTQTKPHVLSVAITSDIETSKATVRDYDFKKPKFKLEKNNETKDKPFVKEADLEQYEFLNNKFTTAAEKQGEILATQHLDEARSRRRTFECKTNFYLPSGTAFTLAGHPRPDVNIELRIIRSHMHLEGATGTPEYTLLCIPNDHPFRPARLPKPRVFGTHLAVVVGETDGSADIDIDKFGRVKVEFHWDRRDLHLGNPTRFVRVSQGWAGAGFGMVLHPRVGHEVIIAYLDGDPDEPMIIGRLHNEHNVSPLKLPGKKTQSIWRSQTSPSGEGHNEIMMEDQQGKELLEFHAQRDNLFTVNAQQDIDVGAKRNDHVKGNVKEDYDADHLFTVGGKRVEVVTGTVKETYGATHSEFKGNSQLEIRGEFFHKVDDKNADNYGEWSTWVKGEWKSQTSDWSHKSPKVEWEIGSKVAIKVPTFQVEDNTLSEFKTKTFDVNASTMIKLHAPVLDVHGENTFYVHPHVEHVIGLESVAVAVKNEVLGAWIEHIGARGTNMIMDVHNVAFEFHNGTLVKHTHAAHVDTHAVTTGTHGAKTETAAVHSTKAALETHGG